MHEFYHWLLALFAFWSSDPSAIEAEKARAAGCVNVAYAALLEEPPAPPAVKVEVVVPEPELAPPVPPTCSLCDGSGKIYRSDGGYVRCKCATCPSGRCPLQTR